MIGLSAAVAGLVLMCAVLACTMESELEAERTMGSYSDSSLDGDSGGDGGRMRRWASFGCSFAIGDDRQGL